MECNIDRMIQSSRLTGKLKDKRDLLIYFLWETGLYRNREIGDLFGLGYSSISRRINITKTRLRKKDELTATYEKLKNRFTSPNMLGWHEAGYTFQLNCSFWLFSLTKSKFLSINRCKRCHREIEGENWR